MLSDRVDRVWRAARAFGVCLAMAAATTVLAHGDHRHDQTARTAPARVAVQLKQAVLTDQHGRERSLMDDVFGERVVVVNFVYTTCTTVCPIATATFAQLQGRLGALLGKDVVLVSITVDPVRDTPQRLKAYAAKHGAGAHWTWLTGPKAAVDPVLKAFGTYTPNPQDHPPVVMVGSSRTRRWTRLYGFPTVDEMVSEVMQHVSECVSPRAATQ
jgi:protein SCO1/2